MTTQSNAIAADNHTYINQLSKHAGAEVVLKGWLYNMRSSGKIALSSTSRRHRCCSVRRFEERDLAGVVGTVEGTRPGIRAGDQRNCSRR